MLNSVFEATEFWCAEKRYKSGKISPDGRLIALILESTVYIYYKESEFSVIPLNHHSIISWIA